MKVNNEINYKPGLIGKIARIIIPILQTILPSRAFKWVYDNLYWLNKRRIWISYSLSSLITGMFSSNEVKIKQSLTRTLLPYTMGGWKALENAFNVTARIEKNKIPGVIIECGVAEGGTAAMMALKAGLLVKKIVISGFLIHMRDYLSQQLKIMKVQKLVNMFSL